MNRRLFIKFLLGVPFLGAMVLFVSPLFRYLKPTAKPLTEQGLIQPPDEPTAVRQITFSLADFPEPWVVQEFLYEQQNPEYTREGAQISRIPGYIMRIPGKSDDDFQFVAVSRICPHMGCIFKYVPDSHTLMEGYNYTPKEDYPHFACPCHLSVYDPLQAQNVEGQDIVGKVVSGPAPRPPRHFFFEVQGDRLVISDLEKGGIA